MPLTPISTAHFRHDASAMIVSLSIRDVVLIDRLDMSFGNGLGVLTGETGAGKSILLDALGLALGARAESGLVRKGAAQATVIAEFSLPTSHAAWRLLAEQGVTAAPDEALVLRRIVGADGRSRATVNDEAVSIGFLRQLGAQLVEIQGQFEQHGLLDPTTHRGLLDAFGGTTDALHRTETAWQAWRASRAAREEAETAIRQARADEDYLRHTLTELDALDPKPGEEEALAETRAVLMYREKLVEALRHGLGELGSDRGAARALNAAARALERVRDRAGGRLEGALGALERAIVETDEAVSALEALARDLDLDGGSVDGVEERLFALRALARKHAVAVDDLPALRARIADQLAAVVDGGARLAALARDEAAARAAFEKVARELGVQRRKAATKFDREVQRELAPLKLDKARFVTEFVELDETSWGEGGIDGISFVVATNPGAAPGPLARIASGGELSRFMLALKVVLAKSAPVPTLVFDEVDSGIGGAVAAAVGERLLRLGDDLQVLVVTHSPQVAAKGAVHWRVAKEQTASATRTRIEELGAAERREEIARMLSGAAITAEARAAADSLLAAPRA